MNHQLKVWKEFFEPLQTRKKTFEVRRNDRGFKAGDILFLCEFDNETETFTGERLTAEVEYVLQGGKFGIEQGYVVMAIKVW